MNKKVFQFFLGGIIILALFFFIFADRFSIFQKEEIKAGAQDNVFGWAWAGVPQANGEKIGLGWISFNCNNSELPAPRCSQTNYGVNIEPDGNLVGYAYFDMDDPNTAQREVGWINFNPSGPYPTCPPSTCPGGSPNYSARVNIDTGEVTGWARALNYNGGWDGWILLGPIIKNGNNHGVFIDTSTGKFSGWAWGSDVVGWISFNCENQNVCSQSNYKVYTTFSFNRPPTADNLRITPQYCQYSPYTWITFQWDYDDPEDTPQSAYQIQIATDSGFGNVVYDSGKISSNADSHTLGPAIGGGGPLSYGQRYYWRVKVWDGDNKESEWSSPNCSSPQVVDDQTTAYTTCFQTPSHAWPEVDFAWKPDPPTVDEIITFIGNATSYGDSSIARWSWTFPGGNPSDASGQQVEVTFSEDGDKEVTLEVEDTSGYTCQKTKTINVKLPLPGIIEIPPK